jgi:CBS domain containing-hemolysin-like protein
MLHTRDMAVALARGGVDLTLRDHLRPILLVPETLPADALLTRFREKEQQAAIVLDEYGGTAGLVTIHDVLDELVGSRETREGDLQPECLPDARLRLPGSLRVDEAVEWLGEDSGWLAHSAPGSESVTVGGRVLEAIGHVPEPGDRVVIDNLEIEVERVANHAIVSVLVKRNPRQEETS